MQSRPIIYTLQQIQSADHLNGWVDTLIGDGNSLQAILGATGTVISNLVVTPQDPASLTLNISNGFIASLQNVDASAYGSLAANTTQVLQLGGNLVTSVLLDNAGLSAGQAQYILIQAGYIQLDSDPVVLPYVNISNPANPYYGPANSGIAQDTVRNAVCDIQVKYGTPATAGSEVAPSPDAGYVTVAYVDLAHGQVAITGGEILNPNLVLGGTDSPVLAGLLQSHHGGIPGQAPQIDLTKEVKNELPMANLFASNIVGAVTAFRTGSGSPNGVLAGNANRNGVCDSYYDVTNNAFYMCTTTGTSSTAVWTNVNVMPTANVSQSGRLYGTTGQPLGDTAFSSTLYFGPDPRFGDTITINNNTLSFTEASISLSTVATGMYDVYVSILPTTLSLIAWVGLNTPPTRTLGADGRYYKPASATNLLLGSIYIASGGVIDNPSSRWISNIFNVISKPGFATDISVNYVYGGPVRPSNANTTDGVGRVSFVFWNPQNFSATAFQTGGTSALEGYGGSQTGAYGIGVNSITSPILLSYASGTYSLNSGYDAMNGLSFVWDTPISVAYSGISLAGFNYIQRLESASYWNYYQNNGLSVPMEN